MKFQVVMSEKTREVPQLADATYAHTLVMQVIRKRIAPSDYNPQLLMESLILAAASHKKVPKVLNPFGMTTTQDFRDLFVWRSPFRYLPHSCKW